MSTASTSSLPAPVFAADSSSAPSASPLRVLTAGLAAGDDTAWAQFHRDYGPGLFRSLLARTRGDHDLASEALQQTYLRVARHARPCDSAAMFDSWLRTVARSALHDCFRRRQSFWAMLSRRKADPSDQLFEETADEQLLQTLESVLATLGDEERALLEAKYFYGANVRALATRMSLSEKAVESRLTRARAELRERLLAALPCHD